MSENVENTLAARNGWTNLQNSVGFAIMACIMSAVGIFGAVNMHAENDRPWMWAFVIGFGISTLMFVVMSVDCYRRHIKNQQNC